MTAASWWEGFMNDAYKTSLATGGLFSVAAMAFTGHVLGPAIVAVLGTGLACAIVWFAERRAARMAARSQCSDS